MGGAAGTVVVAWGETDVAAERQGDGTFAVAAGKEDDIAGFDVEGRDDDDALDVGKGRVLLLQVGWSCGLHGLVWVLVLEEGVCSWVEVDQQALVQKEGHG